jgi:hypothetical protein
VYVDGGDMLGGSDGCLVITAQFCSHAIPHDENTDNTQSFSSIISIFLLHAAFSREYLDVLQRL